MKHKFELEGFEILEKVVKNVKNTAPYVYLPITWKGAKVAIVRLSDSVDKKVKE